MQRAGGRACASLAQSVVSGSLRLERLRYGLLEDWFVWKSLGKGGLARGWLRLGRHKELGSTICIPQNEELNRPPTGASQEIAVGATQVDPGIQA